jgi:hypothetical protein
MRSFFFYCPAGPVTIFLFLAVLGGPDLVCVFAAGFDSTVIFYFGTRGTSDHIILSHGSGLVCSGLVNCCWSSSAYSFLVSGLVGPRDNIFLPHEFGSGLGW